MNDAQAWLILGTTCFIVFELALMLVLENKCDVSIDDLGSATMVVHFAIAILALIGWAVWTVAT